MQMRNDQNSTKFKAASKILISTNGFSTYNEVEYNTRPASNSVHREYRHMSYIMSNNIKYFEEEKYVTSNIQATILLTISAIYCHINIIYMLLKIKHYLEKLTLASLLEVTSKQSTLIGEQGFSPLKTPQKKPTADYGCMNSYLLANRNIGPLILTKLKTYLISLS